MVNEEILGGIKLALSKGESLKRAMMTFFNAGYKREEIEEAAKIAQSQGIQKKETTQEKPLARPQIKKPFLKRKPTKMISDYGKPSEISPEEKKELPKEKSIKKESPKEISNYEKGTSTKGKITLILLIFSLLILVGSLIAVFLFKQEIIDFFKNFLK
jgi:hypothetical protein